jgi:hypothetical protein
MFALEGVDCFDKVVGFKCAVGDLVAGGAAVAAEINLNDAISFMDEDLAVEQMRCEVFVVLDAVEKDECAADGACGLRGGDGVGFSRDDGA